MLHRIPANDDRIQYLISKKMLGSCIAAKIGMLHTTSRTLQMEDQYTSNM